MTTKRTYRLGFAAYLAVAILAAGLLGGAGQAQAAQTVPDELVSYADVILYNGQVLTADSDDPKAMTIAEAVAIRDGKILRVGTNAEIKALAGPKTKRVDAGGKSIVPAAIYSDGDNAVPGGDIHKESQWDGAIQPQMRSLVPTGSTLKDINAKIVEIVSTQKPGVPVFVRASKMGVKGIYQVTKEDLDKLAPNNPLGLWLGSSHGIVNTSLLALAFKKGLPKDHFQVIKDKNGKPTGQLGSQAIGFVGYSVRPWPNLKWMNEVALPDAAAQLRDYAESGVSVATGHMSGLTMTVLARLIRKNQMAMRVYPAHDFIRQNPYADQYLKRIGNLVDFSLGDKRGPMIKIIAAAVGPHSGAPNSAISLMTIEPKLKIIEGLGSSPHGWDKWSAELWTGKKTQELSPEELAQSDYNTLLDARRHGWNLSGIHNMGSGAIKLAIEGIKAAEAQKGMYVPERFKPSGFDHNIDWLPRLYPMAREVKDIMRFSIAIRNSFTQRTSRVLGLKHVLSLQYGEDGVARMTPMRSLVDNGIMVHIEGSAPKAFPERWPMWYIEKAVTRIDDRGEVINPREAVDRMTGLLLMTRWAARYIGEEGNLGSIAKGMWADVVVLNGDYLKVPANKISTLRPVLTLVGGVPAYVEPAFGQKVAMVSSFQAPKVLTKTVVSKLLEIKRGGKIIIFAGPDGTKVKSKVSGKRTKITIAGAKAKRKKLKVGMVCKITYKPGGRNEPKTLDCKQTPA